jgi:hypothetical protein
MDEVKALTARTKPLTRLWDKNFNLLAECEGDIHDLIEGLRVSVDYADGERSVGRVESVTFTDIKAELQRLKELTEWPV